jgi:hypothetical protein
MEKLGRLQPLLQMYEIFMHNAFVQLYKSRKWANAKSVVEQGLATYADSRVLQQDLDLARKPPRQ